MKILILLIWSTILFSQERNEINIHVTSTGKFDVLFHRAQSTATGAILFGLIGAGVQQSIESGKDTGMKKTVLKLVEDASCKSRLIKSLTEKLEQNGYKTNVIQKKRLSKSEKNNTVLGLKIIRCGYRLVNSSTKKMSAFVEFKATLKDKKREIYKNKFLIKSKQHYLFQDLLDDIHKINDELDTVLKKAGARLANKIIYK